MIAIKDMEMPKSCFDCSFCELPGSLCLCKAGHFTYDRKKEFTKKRHPNCPIVEIEKRKVGEWIFEKTVFDKHGCTVKCSSCHKRWKTYSEIRWRKENTYCSNCGSYNQDIIENER